MGKDASGRELPFWAIEIVRARRKAGLTQAQLAERLSMSQSAIADWERGKTRPRVALWRTIDLLVGTRLVQTINKKGMLPRWDSTVANRKEREGDRKYIDLGRNERWRVFLDYLATALEKEGISQSSFGFAARAFTIWDRVTHTGPLSTEEARLVEETDNHVQGLKEILDTYGDDPVTGEKSPNVPPLPETG